MQADTDALRPQSWFTLGPIGYLAITYLLTVSVIWAAITPPGGVPDEPSHAVYAAGVVRGDLGHVERVEHPQYAQLPVVKVPAWLGSFTAPPMSTNAYPFPCYAFLTTTTANCAPEMTSDRELTDIPTTVTRYPPLYYAAVGAPSLLLAGEVGLFAMRAVSALLSIGLIALGLVVASPRRKNWLALGSMVAVTPLAAHIMGSINPSSVEIAGAVGLGAAILGITAEDTRDARPIALSLGVLVVALAWARPLSPVVMLAVVSAGLLLNGADIWRWIRRHRLLPVVVGSVLIALASSGVFHEHFRDLDQPPGGASGQIVGFPEPPAASEVHEFQRRFVELTTDLIGELGWLDHQPPVLVTSAWIAGGTGLISIGLMLGRRRERAALIVAVVGGLVVAPIAIMRQFGNSNIYQARYHLAFVVVALLVAVAVIERNGTDAAWRWLRALATRFVPVAMALAMAASLYRYSIGGQPQLLDLRGLVVGFREWLPDRSLLVVTVLVAGFGGWRSVALDRKARSTASV